MEKSPNGRTTYLRASVVNEIEALALAMGFDYRDMLLRVIQMGLRTLTAAHKAYVILDAGETLAQGRGPKPDDPTQPPHPSPETPSPPQHPNDW